MNRIIIRYTLVCTLGLGAFASVSAEVETSLSGKTISITNNTSTRQHIVGVRFDATAEFTGFAQWGSPILHKENYNGVQLFEIQATRSWDLSPLNVVPDSVFQGDASGAAWDATIEASKYLEPLYSLGVCNEPDAVNLAEPLSLYELQSELKNASYYDVTYRYAKADGLGTKGGEYSGGFWDSYVGETQMQLAMPTGDIPYVGSSAYPWVDSTIATMTFMTLAMGQEMFGVDQQLMLSVGAKETFLGHSSHTSKGTNADGAFGPWEVEGTTFVSRALAYPEYYPFEMCLNDPRSRDGSSASVVCGWSSEWEMGLKYTDEGGVTPLGHPKIISAWLSTAMTWWFNYDLLSQASDYGFKNALSKSADPLIGLCVMAPMYNLGINSGAVASLSNLDAEKALAITCDDFPTGNSNYRPSLMAIAQKFIDAGAAVQSDKSATHSQILDRWISLTQLREFYFGKGADSAKPWLTDGATQSGGLMRHFDIGESQKQALWNDLEQGFNLQARHWGGSKISLRYDWLSNLRLAKQYLDLSRPQIQGEEAANWIAQRSSQPGGIGGNNLDTRFPFVNHSSTTQDSSFNLKVNLSTTDNRIDDRGVKKLEWTTQENWTLFNSMYVSATGNDPKNQTFEINFPASNLEAFKNDASNPNLYVRAIDSCGNAVVTKVPNFLKDQIVSVQEEVHLSPQGVFNESSSFSIYTLNGEFIKSVESLYSPSFQNLRVGRFVLVQGQASKPWTVVK